MNIYHCENKMHAFRVGLSEQLCAEPSSTAVYMINRSPYPSNVTLEEFCSGKITNLKHFIILILESMKVT